MIPITLPSVGDSRETFLCQTTGTEINVEDSVIEFSIKTIRTKRVHLMSFFVVFHVPFHGGFVFDIKTS